MLDALNASKDTKVGTAFNLCACLAFNNKLRWAVLFTGRLKSIRKQERTSTWIELSYCSTSLQSSPFVRVRICPRGILDKNIICVWAFYRRRRSLSSTSPSRLWMAASNAKKEFLSYLYGSQEWQYCQSFMGLLSKWKINMTLSKSRRHFCHFQSYGELLLLPFFFFNKRFVFAYIRSLTAQIHK